MSDPEFPGFRAQRAKPLPRIRLSKPNSDSSDSDSDSDSSESCSFAEFASYADKKTQKQAVKSTISIPEVLCSSSRKPLTARSAAGVSTGPGAPVAPQTFRPIQSKADNHRRTPVETGHPLPHTPSKPEGAASNSSYGSTRSWLSHWPPGSERSNGGSPHSYGRADVTTMKQQAYPSNARSSPSISSSPDTPPSRLSKSDSTLQCSSFSSLGNEIPAVDLSLTLGTHNLRKRKGSNPDSQIMTVVLHDSKRLKGETKELIKHPKHWYAEGNVIVQVEATQFKLHRSRLESHSEYFAQLFRLKSDGCGETLDGVPLCRVSITRLVDFEYLLDAFEDAMYDPSSLC